MCSGSSTTRIMKLQPSLFRKKTIEGEITYIATRTILCIFWPLIVAALGGGLKSIFFMS